MGEVGVAAFKWGIQLSYAMSMVVLFIVFMILSVSAVGVALNGSMVMDLLYFLQLWLPFNLAPLITWLFTAVTAYFAYRLSLLGFTILNRTLN